MFRFTVVDSLNVLLVVHNLLLIMWLSGIDNMKQSYLRILF